MKNKLLILTVLFVSIQPAFALQEIIKTYRGVRSLGMGGVVTTTGRYDEALFGGNPATQMEDEEKKLTILGMTTEANNHLISSFNDLRSVLKASGSDVVSQIAAKQLAGKNEHIRETLVMPGYYNPKFFGENTGFSAGLLTNVQLNVILRDNASVEALGVVDVGPSFGFGHRMLDGNLDVGANVRGVYRLGVDRGIRALDFLTGAKISAASVGGQGFGVDGDIGALYKLPFTPPLMKHFSVGLSVNNVAASEYRVAATTLIGTVKATAPRNDRSFNFGFRSDMNDFLFLNQNILAFELQDFGQTAKEISFWKKLHMGGETTVLGKLLSLRAGFNQGYLGGGFGLNLPIIKIDFATYGEELAANTGQLEDRRYVIRFSFDI